MFNKLLRILFPGDVNAPSFDDLPYNIEINDLIFFLLGKLPDGTSSQKIRKQVDAFNSATYKDKINQLPSIYLSLEQFLINQEDRKSFSRNTLRNLIAEKYQTLLEIEHFQLIFEEKTDQELHLGKLFLLSVIQDLGEIESRKLVKWITIDKRSIFIVR